MTDWTYRLGALIELGRRERAFIPREVPTHASRERAVEVLVLYCNDDVQCVGWILFNLMVVEQSIT